MAVEKIEWIWRWLCLERGEPVIVFIEVRENSFRLSIQPDPDRQTALAAEAPANFVGLQESCIA